MSPLASADRLPSRTAFLKQITLFAQLDEPDLVTLSQELVLREYAKGEIIFRQGDPSGHLFIVSRGKVRIFRMSPAGNETSINLFSRFDIFGEFAILDGEPRSATAQAIEACALLAMPGEKFLEYLDQMPKLAMGMIRLLVSKARWTAAYAETIAQYDAAGRLLHLLLLYCEQFGEEEIPGKRYVIDLGLNQTDLASLVGARREWVNHLLQQWSKRGILEYGSGRIVILDLPRVKEERDSRTESAQRSAEW